MHTDTQKRIFLRHAGLVDITQIEICRGNCRFIPAVGSKAAEIMLAFVLLHCCRQQRSIELMWHMPYPPAQKGR